MKKIKLRYIILSLILMIGTLGYFITYNSNKGYCDTDYATNNVTPGVAPSITCSLSGDATSGYSLVVTGTATSDATPTVPILNLSQLKTDYLTPYQTTLTSIEFKGDITFATNTSFYVLFCGYTNLKSVKFASGIDTSNVINMYGMFSNSKAITTIDVSHFDTSNVTNMGWMFNSCEALTSLDVSSFDTSNVTDMSVMFKGCSSLTSLDVSNFNTDDVTTMNTMFGSCSKLTTLDLSNFDTSSLTDVYGMFSFCTSLQELDISNFNLSKVTTRYNYFFNYNYCLTKIHLPKNIGSLNITLPSYSEWKGYDDTETLIDSTTYTSLTIRNTSNLSKIQYLKGTIYISYATAYDSSDQAVWYLPYVVYTGSAIKPVFKLKYNGVELTKEIDYDLTYDDNINIGECEITVTGKGNYTGTKNIYFNIIRDPSQPFDYATNNAIYDVAPSITCTLTGDTTNGYTLDVTGKAQDADDITTYPVLNFSDFYNDYINTYRDTIKNINFKGEMIYAVDFGGFFSCMSMLESVTLSDNFSICDCTMFNGMFAMNPNLKSVKLGKKYKFVEPSYAYGLFYDCPLIETLDLSNLNVNDGIMTYYAGSFDSTRMEMGFTSNCNSLTTIYFGNDWTTWGYGMDDDVDEDDTFSMHSKLFTATTTEKLKTKIILPSDATDALVKLVSPYNSDTNPTGYDWASDNRLIRIYKGTEVIYAEWEEEIVPEEDDDNNQGGGSTVKEEKSTSITVSSGTSSDVLNQSLNNTGYIKGYTSSSLFGNSTKKFKPNENITRAEIATIFTRIDLNYNANKDYSSSSLKYTDLTSNKWYSSAVGYVTERNIMKGYGETFNPDGNLTRAELCAAICNYKNINLSVALSYNGILTDIDDKWYTNYVKTLSKMGYINGYLDGTFRGDEPVTRAEACKIINKMLNIDTSKLVKENEYSDINESDWYYIDVVNASMN